MYSLECPSPPVSGACSEGWVVVESSVPMTQSDFSEITGAVAFVFALAAVFKIILRMMNL